MRTQYIIPVILTVNEDLAQGDELELLLSDIEAAVRSFDLAGMRVMIEQPCRLKTFK